MPLSSASTGPIETTTCVCSQRVATSASSACCPIVQRAAQWAQTLRRRFEGRRVAICLELAKGPLVHALQQYDFLVLFPVKPLMV